MSKLQRYIVAAVITAVVVFLVWYFSNVVTYILIAAVLAIIGKPLTDLLTGLHLGRSKIRIPKAVAALLTLIVIWLVVVGLFWLFVPILFQKLNQFSSLNISQIVASFQGPLVSLEHMIEKVFSIPDNEFSLADAIAGQIRPLLNINLINNLLSSIVGTIGSLLIAIFSISFITFFFLKDDELFLSMLKAPFPERVHGNIERAMSSVSQLLMRYFTGILSESCILMIVISVTMIFFGMRTQDAFFIGLIMGVMNVVPYAGPLIGGVMSVFMGVVTPIEGMTTGHTMFVIAGSLLIIKGFDDFVLQPTLYSERVKAHPLEIFIVILIAGSLAGIVGMLLAIPSYTVLRVFAKEFFSQFRLVQKLTEKI